MSFPQPQASQRRVLLAVTGLTPQVITETLFALMREGMDQLPQEIQILTTAEGAERARLMLLSEQPGWLQRFISDFKLPTIGLRLEHIHVLRDAEGEPLADIRTAQHNALAADQIAELVRTLTCDDSSALHLSLAGGRKTLGFFAGYALSLWGRPQDRLSHVLASEPFESSWDFFYPTPYERIIETRGGNIADCAQAEVTLADIPFVRLRHGLPQRLLDGQTTFAGAVAAAQGHVGPPRLTIDLRRQCIEAAGRLLAVPPAELAFLAWFARRAQRGLEGLASPRDGVPDTTYAEEYLAEYRSIRGAMGDDERTRLRYRKGMEKADFAERKSKLTRVLRAGLEAAAQPYLIEGTGKRPMRYRLDLPADRILFVT